MELLAPAFARPEVLHASQPDYQAYFTTESAHNNLCSLLFFEEQGSEERESKHTFANACAAIEIFNDLKKFKPVSITRIHPAEQSNSQPLLFTLHRVFRI